MTWLVAKKKPFACKEGGLIAKLFTVAKQHSLSSKQIVLARQARLCLALYYSKKLLWAHAVLLGGKKLIIASA